MWLGSKFMNNKTVTSISALSILIILSLAPMVSLGSTPVLNPPPASLPSPTYYVNGTSTHYTITTTEWDSFFSDIIDNKSFVSYNWSANTTQDLIVFDLSYTGMNPYGMEIVYALSTIGFPSVQNFTKAFWMVANKTSMVTSGGTHLTNLKALDSGAFPGFTWSKPRVTGILTEYRDAAIILAIFAGMFVMYFYFNRKR